jgi:DNA-binding Lrp family transcriptional regulator
MQKIELDEFDFRLLAALQADGRLTNQELADKVGLSASQCSRRRSRLEEAGIIRGYHADLSAEALGLSVLVFIHVTLATHSPDNSKRFRDLVGRLDEVQEAYSLTGETDYLLKMVLPDLKSLATTVNERLLAHDTVAHVRSSVVLDRLKETSRLPLKRTG